MTEPIDLDAKRLEAFSVSPPARKRPPGPGRGHKVKMGSGMPATGGWGGPAKGAGKDPRETPIEVRRTAMAIHKARMPEKEAAADELKATLYDLATDNEQPGGVRVMAASAALDRLEGKPVQRTITANADDLARLTDDELRAELERFGRTGA